MKDIQIKNSNGCDISATIFVPSNIRGAIMIAPATGISKKFYSSFANYLRESGYGVITFDNEGIGNSLRGPIKNSEASLVSWGQSDMSAIFNLLRSEFPNVDYHLIGHSAGGQLVGLMDGALELASIFNVACSSGSLRNMKFPFNAKAQIFMNLFMPISNLLLGYAHNSWLGMGEPLPKKCAQQWTKWCNGKGYIQTHFEHNKIPNYYHNLECPSLWINATDDDIANDINVDEMINVFPKLNARRLILEPSKYQFKEIGHMKFFSKKNSILWKIATGWLDNPH